MSDLVEFERLLADESATVAFGGDIAQAIQQLNTGVTIYLNGELGAGKTTLTRGIVTGFGHFGKVKSPTYTLVEPYSLESWQLYHFDLYRLADPEELEFMGIRDYFADNTICIVEWPARGEGFLPMADLLVDLVYVDKQRQVKLTTCSDKGHSIVQHLCDNIR